MKLEREDFPTIFNSDSARPRYQERFDEVLKTLNNAIEQGSIRNVEMKDVKSRCSDAARKAYGDTVSEPFVWAMRFKDLPQAVQDLEMSISFSGIHSIKSIKKKVDACDVDHPCVKAIKAWVEEYLPLTKAIEDLKSKVVMGRAPSKEPVKPVNPNKDVKTCPCCFRPIAVVASTMAHHGYKRPGQGMQTSSCPGVRFKPLELSPDGLKYMSAANASSIVMAKDALKMAPQIQSFTSDSRTKQETITREDPRFARFMDNHIHKLERDIAWHERDKAMFDERIKNWKPDMKHKQVAPDDESPSP